MENVTLWVEDFSVLVVFGVVQKMATLLQLVLMWFGFLVSFLSNYIWSSTKNQCV